MLQYFPATAHPLVIKGLYDVLVEFEDVERMGNLNSGKVFYTFAFNQGAANDLPNSIGDGFPKPATPAICR